MRARVKAFCIHLLLSLALGAALVALFMFFWFPMPYFVADGGWWAFRTVVGVDVVVGPVLTFVAFSPGKTRRKLVFDLTIIGLLQLAALGAGLITIYPQRTVMTVLADGFVYPLDAGTVELLGQEGKAILAATPLRPAPAMIDLPADPAARQKARIQAMASQRPIYLISERIKPLDAATLPELRVGEEKVERFLRSAPDGAEKLAAFLQEKGGQTTDYLFVPVVARFKNFLLAYRRSDLAPVGWIWVNAKFN
jgi:hypothetical protein